jgi:hypothetical protein
MWQKLKSFFGIGLLLSGCFAVWAKEYFPKGCKALPLKTVNMELEAQPDQLMFMHNISPHEIWLANPSRPKWTVGLQPGRWNVLYLPQGTTHWRCIQSETGHEQQVSCQEVIAVCQWPATIPKGLEQKVEGWVLENQSIVVAHAYLQRMGWLFGRHSSK